MKGCGCTQVIGLALLLSFVGCDQAVPVPAPVKQPPEPSLAEQADAVREGRSETVRLDHTLVRDDDLAPLDELGDNLRRINLSRTEITDEGLARLCRHRQLEQLRLSSPRVTDAGLASVAELAHLRFLHLLDMPITDKGLDRLQGLKSLESLYLDHTHVTDAGLARLLAALPEVHLHIDDHHHPLDSHGKNHTHEHEHGE